MPKGIPSKRYTPEFKKIVIETMLAEKLSYRETASRFDVSCDKRIKDSFICPREQKASR